MTMEAWERALADTLPRVKAIRRDLHRRPELSGQEKQTRDFILRLLKEMGISATTFDGCYAVMGRLQNGEGRCVAIRADMDALPVTEATGLSFASERPGVMHACGHDVHMALALGSALWLSQNRDKWRGEVRWLFEPEEETTGGGRLMAAQGCMDGVDVVIGQHVNPRYAAGTFYARPGYVSGASDRLEIVVKGRSCHGAYPESGVDAIVLTAQVVSALQSLVSRTISPFEPAVVTFGRIEGGTANNIICGEVKLTGTLRTLSPDTRRALQARLVSVTEGVARGMGGDAEVIIDPGYGAVYNDDRAYAVIEKQAEELFGAEKVVRREAASLGVESFCYFIEKTPGVYYDLGSGVGPALHTPGFLVDEDCLLPGLALQCASVLALLKEE